MNRRDMLKRALTASPAAALVAAAPAEADPDPDADDQGDDDGILIDRPYTGLFGFPNGNFVRYTIAPADHPGLPPVPTVKSNRSFLHHPFWVRMGDLVIHHGLVPRWEVLTDERDGRQPWPLDVRYDRSGTRPIQSVVRRWAPGDMDRCRLCETCCHATWYGPDICLSEAPKDISSEEARVWSHQFQAPYPLHGEMDD